jgi:hypothetical protein
VGGRMGPRHDGGMGGGVGGEGEHGGPPDLMRR